jgi:hypothetical protein
MTPTVKKKSPGGLVLNTEKGTMKLNKYTIIANKMINGEEILANLWNMKDAIQANRGTG